MNFGTGTRKAKIVALLAGTTLVASCTGLGNTPSAASQAALSGSAAPITPQERQTGAEAHEQIVQEFGGAYSGPKSQYVEEVGRNIATYSGLAAQESAFTVSFLNSAVNNAFAIPGGYIYITRQLAALCNDEAEMAGVLGHEVGHVAARHSQQRQQAATNYGLLGVLGQIAGGLLGDSGGIGGLLGGLLQNYSGTAAQLATLGYSRGQEEEADTLGIRYLAEAGYDPTALSSMLFSLSLQTTVDARVAGRDDARSMPEWASTHPDPAERVVRARNIAVQQFGTTSKRNRDTYLARMDGLMYGDDPDQGVIEGQKFLYQPTRLEFSIPNGFAMQNGPSVSISGTGGQGQFVGAQSSGSLDSHISQVWQSLGANTSRGTTQTTTVNGIPAAYSLSRVNTQSGQVDVTIFAYKWDSNTIYHFLTLSQAGRNPFEPMFTSVRRMSAAEAAAIKARKLDVVTVGSGDTVAKLANRMAYDDYKEIRFRALNGMAGNDTLTAGQKVKIVTY